MRFLDYRRQHESPPRLGAHVCRTPEPPRLPRLPGHLRAQLAHLSSRRPPRRRPGRPSRPRLARRQRHRRRRHPPPRWPRRLARRHPGGLCSDACRPAPAGGGETMVADTETVRARTGGGRLRAPCFDGSMTGSSDSCILLNTF